MSGYWNVGAHTSFSVELCPTILTAQSYGMRTTQFFMGNPRSCIRTRIKDADICKAILALKHQPMNVFTHFPYPANMNGTASCLAWGGNQDVDKIVLSMINELEYELGVLSNFKTKKNRVGIVIHPGTYRFDRNSGLQAIAKTINLINFLMENGPKLLLENCAGEGTKMFRDFSEFAEIISHVDEEKKSSIGVCVDTAHIWGQGDYDLRRKDEIDRMFSDFDRIIGLERFTLLHLNDSAVVMGSKKDRHACLTRGHIWKDDVNSLIHLLNKCKDLGIPAVLETAGTDMLFLNHLSQFANDDVISV
jgi:deoxyribonuclease-4